MYYNDSMIFESQSSHEQNTPSEQTQEQPVYLQQQEIDRMSPNEVIGRVLYGLRRSLSRPVDKQNHIA